MTNSVILWLIVALVLLLLIAVGVFLWQRRKRAQQAALPQGPIQLNPTVFSQAMSTLYDKESVRSRYDIPCILVCSEEKGIAPGVLQSAQLDRVESHGDTDNGWWQNMDGVAFELPDEAMQSSGKGATPWHACVDLFEKFRPQRPLDGLLWIIPLQMLQDSDGKAEKRIAEMGTRMCEKMFDIQTRLGLQLPVYVAISGCETTAGFGEFAAALPQSLQQQGLAWSNPYALGLSLHKEWVEDGVRSVMQRLQNVVAELGAQQDLGTQFDDIFLLPDRLNVSLKLLPELLQVAFRQNATLEPFNLRSIHLIGEPKAASSAAPDPYQPAPNTAPPYHPIFCRDWFARRIFAEFGLARLVKRRLMYNQTMYRRIIWGSSAVAGLWLICLLVAHHFDYRNAQNMVGPLALLKAEIRDSSDSINQDDTVESLRELDGVRDWSLSSIFMPLSWAGPFALDDDIQNILRQYHERVLFRSIDLALHVKANELVAMQSPRAANKEILSSSLEQMPEYVTLNEFVDQTLEYERHRKQFLGLVQADQGTLNDLSDLLTYLFKVKPANRTPEAQRQFNEIVRTSSYSPHIMRTNVQATQDLSKHLAALHDAWLTKLFRQNRLSELGDKLEKQLAALNDGSLTERQDLVGLQHTIADLRSLLARSNLTWMADGSQMSESYQKMLAKIDKSDLISKSPGVVALKSNAVEAQQQFSKEINEEASGDAAMFDYAEGKHLQLRADVVELDAAIGQLLRHGFAQSLGAESGSEAASANSDSVIAWDGSDLDAAQAAYQDYLNYEATELPKAPSRFLVALQRIAREQAALQIHHDLLQASSNTERSGNWRSSGFESAQKQVAPLVAGLRKLDQVRLANNWDKVLHQQAALLLRNLNDDFERGALYQPDSLQIASWDGKKQGALRAYGAAAPADLQDYLATQAATVTEFDEASKAPRAWLERDKAAAAQMGSLNLDGWKKIDGELVKYAAKSPAASIKQLEQLIAEDLNDLDQNNCSEKLAHLARARDGDFFQHRGQQLVRQFTARCQALQMDAVRAAYNGIADYFNTRLLHRYPFAGSYDAPSADPDTVLRFLALLDSQFAIAHDGLMRMQEPGDRPALVFLERLAATRPLLSAILSRDPLTGNPSTLDLVPEFRINRFREKGGNQIIEWKIYMGPGAQSNSANIAATDKPPTLFWRLGDPIITSLRWAKDGDIVPSLDLDRFPDTRVEERIAQWEYTSQWALLRFLSQHSVSSAELDERESSMPQALRFTVPTRHVDGLPAGDAIVYGRLGMSLHGKTDRLSYAAFPTTPAPPLANVPWRQRVATAAE